MLNFTLKCDRYGLKPTMRVLTHTPTPRSGRRKALSRVVEHQKWGQVLCESEWPERRPDVEPVADPVLSLPSDNLRNPSERLRHLRSALFLGVGFLSADEPGQAHRDEEHGKGESHKFRSFRHTRVAGTRGAAGGA